MACVAPCSEQAAGSSPACPSGCSEVGRAHRRWPEAGLAVGLERLLDSGSWPQLWQGQLLVVCQEQGSGARVTQYEHPSQSLWGAGVWEQPQSRE